MRRSGDEGLEQARRGGNGLAHPVLTASGLALVAATFALNPAFALPAARCRDSGQQTLVPAGSFWMGSDQAERALARRLSGPETVAAGWFRGELPRHRVRLDAFCIDRRLVTQSHYAEFVGVTRHRVPGITRAEYRRQGFLVHDYDAEVSPYLWIGRRPPVDKSEHPVVLVSAPDAESFCRWRDPRGSLPSEAELEAAARGAAGRIFPWGDAWDPDRLNSAERGPGMTTRVDQYRDGASPYGMLDAVGNVFQWTASRLEDGRRVLKGCAWDDDAGLCRPAFRHGRPAASRHILIGFRCREPAEVR